MVSGKLAIIIIAGNESSMITDCLKSALFADQIILVAANSTDGTIALAQSIYPKLKTIIVNDEYGRHFAKWRNLGLEAAKCQWVYYLDADERITTQLKQELNEIISKPKYNYYVNSRQNFYLGHAVKYGGSYPDYVKRLFLKSSLLGWTGILHEEPNIVGEYGYLKSSLTHLTHRSLNSMLQKSLIWTDMEARELLKIKHPPIVWWRLIRMMLTTFFNRLIKQQMWRDGTVGWISVIFETFDTFMIYSRLWELQQKEHN